MRLLLDWFIDLFLSIQIGYPDTTELPPLESKDGQESTVESRRQDAQAIDAKRLSEPSKQFSSRKNDRLDQEFWEAF